VGGVYSAGILSLFSSPRGVTEVDGLGETDDLMVGKGTDIKSSPVFTPDAPISQIPPAVKEDQIVRPDQPSDRREIPFTLVHIQLKHREAVKMFLHPPPDGDNLRVVPDVGEIGGGCYHIDDLPDLTELPVAEGKTDTEGNCQGEPDGLDQPSINSGEYIHNLY